MKRLATLALLFLTVTLYGQNGSTHGNKFEQLYQTLQDPNIYRSASGAPGPKYWQQQVDYDIDVTLIENEQRIKGNELITYYNNSPDALTYLWLQLDENEHVSKNDNQKQNSSTVNDKMSAKDINRIINADNDYGDNIEKITDAAGKDLKYTINQTMMRIELPNTLKPGEKFSFRVRWNYKQVNRTERWGRGGYEYFKEDSNYVFTCSQWFPRLCVYSDYQGWNNKQFTGTAEFALPFGNYKVRMTVPADFIIGATGQCDNYSAVLSADQLSRWKKAQNATKEPVEIVLLDEAKKSETNQTTKTKTWSYHAENVRDFAWIASPKLIWDAMSVTVEGNKTMAMSYYPKEAYGLYRKFSTKVVATTLQVYSKHTIPYPYPVAISCEASSGMEYPMICFNYGRTEKDGSYSEATKNGMTGVIIHEVGHNYFPMIINSDERQWTWMDEGLNTFCQFLTEQAWDARFPSGRGPAHKIVDYMKLPKDQLEPIMTNGENLASRGSNAYGKPATALNILRETIMGRELFDYAFKEYARRWAFKHPTSADFFRTMEDASAVDLDWFWRGWFYGTDACDIAIEKVSWYKIDTKNPEIENAKNKSQAAAREVYVSRTLNNQEGKSTVEQDTSIQDFYTTYDKFETTAQAKTDFTTYYESLNADEKKIYDANKNFYQIEFKNIGGLVMPIILEMTFTDGSKKVERIPAYIWRMNESAVKKVFVTDKEVASFQLDPYLETADIDLSNNTAGKPTGNPSKFELFKDKQTPRGSSTDGSPMQKAMQKK